MKKTISKSIFVLALLVMIYIAYVIINVFNIEKAVWYAFMSDGKSPEKVSEQMAKEVYYSINSDQDYSERIVRKRLILHPVFAVFGLNKGSIWMNYTFSAYAKGGKLDHGSSDVIFTLLVKRRGLRWIAVDKEEGP